DVSRRATQHSFGLFADGQNVGGARLNRHDRGFSQNNPPITDIDQGVGGPEVNPNVIGKQAFKLCEHELCPPPAVLLPGSSLTGAHLMSREPSGSRLFDKRERRPSPTEPPYPNQPNNHHKNPTQHTPNPPIRKSRPLKEDIYH